MSEQKNLQWPEHLWPLADVTNWIASTSTNISNLEGPTHIYNLKMWGVTAAFLLNDEEVIFKACKLPLFQKRVETEWLLSRHAPSFVPELLGAKTLENGETWSLHSSFSGPDVEQSGAFENILEMARALARLQTRIAKLPATELDGLNHTPITQIPNMFDHMLKRIEESYLTAWLADDRKWLREFNLPADVLNQLIDFRPQVLQWVEELSMANWPVSIDHLDFNISNAAVEENSSLLIFDWEEATISCPFFSMDRLLQDADAFEEDPENVPQIDGPLRMTKNQMAVRNGYLQALPWKSLSERERGFDIAMCLSPIKTAYECEPFNEALGRQNGLPPHAARCFGIALHRWTSEHK